MFCVLSSLYCNVQSEAEPTQHYPITSSYLVVLHSLAAHPPCRPAAPGAQWRVPGGAVCGLVGMTSHLLTPPPTGLIHSTLLANAEMQTYAIWWGDNTLCSIKPSEFFWGTLVKLFVTQQKFMLSWCFLKLFLLYFRATVQQSID